MKNAPLPDDDVLALADHIRSRVTRMLESDDYRGGPLQRQYPPAVIRAIADGAAAEVEEWFAAGAPVA